MRLTLCSVLERQRCRVIKWVECQRVDKYTYNKRKCDKRLTGIKQIKLGGYKYTKVQQVK